MMLKGVKQFLVESPTSRTVFGFVVPLVAGVVSGLFVNEITRQNSILWADFYKAKSFYGLIILGVIIFLYNRAVFVHEKELSTSLIARQGINRVERL
jgi:hypothetical protein